MVVFWTDDDHFDHYALAIWFPDNDPRNIRPKGSKFESLCIGAFMTDHWCCPH